MKVITTSIYGGEVIEASIEVDTIQDIENLQKIAPSFRQLTIKGVDFNINGLPSMYVNNNKEALLRFFKGEIDEQP